MKAKEPYEKPELLEIELKAEEVLAVGCKMPGPRANVGQAMACGLGVPCVQRGS